MKDGITYKTNVYRFNVKKGEWVLRRDYEMLQNFKFSGIEFYLLLYNKCFFVTYLTPKGDLYSLTYKRDNGDVTAGEVASEFRKQFLKNAINKDLIEKFLQDPLNFKKNRE